MARISAQLLLSIAASMTVAGPACVLPPYLGSEDQLGPYPPYVDRDSLYPRSARTRLSPLCGPVSVEAGRIIDLDTRVLSFRWVANNGVENTKLLAEDEDEREPGMPHSESQRLEHGFDFGFNANDPTLIFTGVLSLFISDAPATAWAEDPDDLDPGESRDLGRINDPNDEYNVVEVRWTFEYDASLGSGACTD